MIQYSCKKNNNSGTIILTNLKRDTSILISTNQTTPSTLKLYVEKPLGFSFKIDNSIISPNTKKDTIVEDRYNKTFSIQVEVLQSKSGINAVSLFKKGVTVKIAYLLL